MIKPSVLFIFVLCISGYNFLNKLHFSHYALKRSNGYHTFLRSAVAGLFLFLFSSVLYIALLSVGAKLGIQVSYGGELIEKAFLTKVSPSVVAMFEISFFSILISYFLPYVLYKIKDRNREFLREFSQDTESPEFTKLFFSSLQYGLPILFTMKDRKVYIGYVFEIYSKDFNDVHLLPIFSGYRDKDTLELVPITPYQEIIKDVENEEEKELDLEAFLVTLPLREICHAHLHDFSYYTKFKEQERRYTSSEGQFHYKFSEVEYEYKY